MQEHAVLLRAYARVQERCSRLLVEQAALVERLEAQIVRLRGALVERLEAQIVRLRGALVARDSAMAMVREELAARAAVGAALPKRLHALLAPGTARRLAVPVPVPVAADLREKAVLCVGGDERTPSLARQLVEIAGGRFLHFEGADGTDDPAFEASLRAADLVICQTGCLSHDACWRVQDHCRRTGKPCVMVGEPQPIHFVRRETAEEAAAERALPAG